MRAADIIGRLAFSAKYRSECWIDDRGGERVLAVTHGISECAKRATCAVIGHRVEHQQDMYDGEWEAYCERCGDEGNFDSFKRIPNPFAWWLQDRIAAVYWRFHQSES